MYHKKRRPIRMFETLESRQLLAADLIVEHDPYPAADVGEEVTRTIRVHNVGDEVAEQALIRSSLSDELLDSVWTRYVREAKFIQDSSAGRQPDLVISDSGTANEESFIVGARQLGDVDGDGLNDIAVDLSVREVGERRFRRLRSAVVWGGVTADVDTSPSRLGQAGLSVVHERTWDDGISKLGDLNGDGFDEVVLLDRILFGRSEIGELGQANLTNELAESVGVRVAHGESRTYQVFGLGDLNADGFDDLAVSHSTIRNSDAAVVWGHAEIGDVAPLDLATLPEAAKHEFDCNNSGCRSWDRTLLSAAPIGDFNDDGVQDVAFFTNSGITVLYGGPEVDPSVTIKASIDPDQGFRIPVESRMLFGLEPFSETTDAHVIPMRAGDVDGDGIDDLLLSFKGGNCFGCTATDRGYDEYTGGAVVIYGGQDIAADGLFDSSRGRVSRFELTVDFGTVRPYATAWDSNQDGRTDIEIATNHVSYLNRDVTRFEDLDLGIGARVGLTQYAGFNGEDGYGQLGHRFRIDINGDGLLDEVVRDQGRLHVFLEEPHVAEQFSGEGDIAEQLDIAPGTSLVYEVRGTLRDAQTTITTSALPHPAQRFEELSDNIASSQTGVLLEAFIEDVQHDAATRQTQFDIRVSNLGPSPAKNVLLTQNLTRDLTEVQWTRVERPFPAAIQLDALHDAAGRFDTGPRRRPQWGNAGTKYYPVDLGLPAAFSPTLNTEAMGDINGDGLPDKVIGNDRANDGRGEVVVVFGTDAGIPELSRDQLNGQNGFAIEGHERADFFGTSVATGDVNDDGFDDVVFMGGVMPATSPPAPPIASVVFGRPSFSTLFDVDDLDGSNGFRMLSGRITVEPGPGPVSVSGSIVASDFDSNGDGIDDIYIETFVGGTPCEGCAGFGKVKYVVFGQRQSNEAGIGKIPDTVDIPFRGEVTYTIRGRSSVGPEVVGSVAVTPSLNQIQLDPTTTVARLAPADVNIVTSPVTRIVGPAEELSFGVTVRNDGPGTASIRMQSTSSESAPDLQGLAWQRDPFPAVLDYERMTVADGFQLQGGRPGSDRTHRQGVLGDINGDGFDDFFITPVTDHRQVFIVFGESEFAEPDAEPLSIVRPERSLIVNNADWVAPVGDVNGDGYDDFAFRGLIEILVYLGGPTLAPGVISSESSVLRREVEEGRAFTLRHCCRNSDQQVSDSGDFNGDGLSDILLNVSDRNEPWRQSYVLFGSEEVTNRDIREPVKRQRGFVVIAADQPLIGETQFFADVNGDGFDDVVVKSESTLTGSSRLDVIWGRDDATQVVDTDALNGANGFSLHGVVGPISSAGDVNGDGKVDLLVGSPGEPYLLLGSEQFVDRANWQFDQLPEGSVSPLAVPPDYRCAAMNTIGDINHDGFADFLVADLSFQERPAGRVVLGGPEMSQPLLPDGLKADGGFVLTAPFLNAATGACSQVDSGDLNGDGITDPIVSGQHGKTLVVFGRDTIGGHGLLEDTLTLPSGHEATYVVSLRVPEDYLGEFSLGFTATSVDDPDMADNVTSFSIHVQADHLTGDLELDGDVDFADFLILATNFGKQSGALLSEGDLDGDEDIDLDDYRLLIANFGRDVTTTDAA